MIRKTLIQRIIRLSLRIGIYRARWINHIRPFFGITSVCSGLFIELISKLSFKLSSPADASFFDWCIQLSSTTFYKKINREIGITSMLTTANKQTFYRIHIMPCFTITTIKLTFKSIWKIVLSPLTRSFMSHTYYIHDSASVRLKTIS